MTRQELRPVFLCIALVLLATLVPFAVAWWYTPLNAVFPGILFNSDDQGVYFAWIKQGHDGHLLFRNLFTSEPQRGIYPHVYFLLLGWLSRLPGLDIPLAYHLGRLAGGAVTLLLAYCLIARATPDRFTRLCALWTVALSGGVGWLLWSNRLAQSQPVDVWQPEAITFPSLYTNGLFAVSLALMLGVVVCLLRAEEEPQRGAWWAVGAGLCGLVLGNIHSYDMIHLTVVWAAYLVVRWVIERRFPARAIGLGLLAAVVAAPSVAYMAWLYKTEPIFKARADVATLSPNPWLYVLGYGLLLPLAAWGGWQLWHSAPSDEEVAERSLPSRAAILLAVWPVAGLVAAYLPFAFQRKMVMGTHLPLGLLAGVAVAALAQQAASRAKKPKVAGMVAVVGVLLLSFTSFRYLERDIRLALVDNRTSTYFHPAFWPAPEIQAFTWLGTHTPPNAALFCYPLSGVLVPAYSGRTVYAGHWGETPDFPEKVREAERFFGGEWSSEQRREFLRRNGITHLYLGERERLLMERGAARGATPVDREPFLRLVFQEGNSAIFEVTAS